LREAQTAAAHRRGRRALFAGGGRAGYFAERHNIPVAETIGRAWHHAARPSAERRRPRVIGAASANALAAEADVVLAVRTRLQDFSTGSWTVSEPETIG